MYILEIDQVPEQNRVFETYNEVLSVVINENFNGHYTNDMSLRQLTNELSKNGCYLSDLDSLLEYFHKQGKSYDWSWANEIKI